MLGPLTGILWQLERNKKYGRPCGTSRIVTAAKVSTLLIMLCLVYLIMYAVLLGSGENRISERVFKPSDYHPSSNHISSFGKLGKLVTKDSKSEDLPLDVTARLSERFYQADNNGDGYLEKKELISFINNEIANHFTKAMKDNFEHYFKIDKNPRNGLVSWDEYLEVFFEERGISGVTAQDILKRTPAFLSLPKDVKVEIARTQASWSEAALNNPDFLTVDEYLAFEHPEASPTKIISDVQDIFATFDLNGDGTISQQEFETTYREAEGVDPIYETDKHVIDADGNGEISRVELMRYMDPRSLHHSVKEAKELIKDGDKNGDGRLTLAELLKTSSKKIVDTKFYDVESNYRNS